MMCACVRKKKTVRTQSISSPESDFNTTVVTSPAPAAARTRTETLPKRRYLWLVSVGFCPAASTRTSRPLESELRRRWDVSLASTAQNLARSEAEASWK